MLVPLQPFQQTALIVEMCLFEGYVSVSGIRWAICKSAPRSGQITTPAPHHSVFLQAGCPSCCPTNSVKALTAEQEISKWS